uniref:Integrase catalytic domain-containing protein n=1 Tax=Tanacetum cinerariifolium TaxID=118510 RepID=A0A6L2LUB4_TANCI|nr:hypothetical protein [Tanacetum cinerariifolium]
MAHPAQNINHSAFRSMFEKEIISRNNFKLIPENVLAKWNAIYDAHNEVACLMLGSMNHELHKQCENYSPYEMLRELKSMFEKQAGVERFDLIQTFHDCKQEDGKPVSTYVLKLKDYVKQLERLGYVLPQDLSVGLILNGLTSDFFGFVRNYNMHNMGKTIGELHALIIEYEKGLPTKTATPQVMAIQGGRIQKANKKSQKAKGKGKWKGKGKDKSYILNPKNPKPYAKENPTKNDACHQYKEVGHWKRNCHVYLAEGFRGERKLEQGALYLYVDYRISVSKNDVLYFNYIPSIGIYEIDTSNLVPNVNSIYNVSNKRVKHNLDSTYLWHCHLAHISKKNIEKMQHGGLLKSTDDESFDQYMCQDKVLATSLPLQMVIVQLTPPYTSQHNGVSERKNRTLLDMVRSMINLTTLPLSFWDYALESTASILNMVPTKKVNKTPYKLWYGKVPNLSYLKVRSSSRRAGELEEIQDKVTPPSEITSEIPMEVEGFEPPHEEEAPVRRSVRTHRAPERLCLNVEVEEHNLGDLNEPANYKAAMLDSEYNKWLDALNTKMQFMKDNQVWRLVDLPPNSKGYTKLYGVDNEETFLLVADIRAIRVLIAIVA